MPLEAQGGQQVEVEFVSNVYQVGHRHIAQCNIRDISETFRGHGDDGAAESAASLRWQLSDTLP